MWTSTVANEVGGFYPDLKLRNDVWIKNWHLCGCIFYITILMVMIENILDSKQSIWSIIVIHKNYEINLSQILYDIS